MTYFAAQQGVSVSQEMFEEYFRGLNLPGTPAHTFRLRVFLFFDMIQEPLTPAEYEDGCAFFRTARCTVPQLLLHTRFKI